MSKKILKKKRAAFSMVELIVSMGIVAIILVMLNTVIINTAIAAQKSLARGFIREEMTTASDLVASDIRSADRIGACGGSLAEGNLRCEIFGLQNLVWQNCEMGESVRVCKVDEFGNILYSSSETLVIEEVSFEVGFGTGSLATRRNIIFTMVGGHRNENMDISNIVRQSVVSTRNYVLI